MKSRGKKRERRPRLPLGEPRYYGRDAYETAQGEKTPKSTTWFLPKISKAETGHRTTNRTSPKAKETSKKMKSQGKRERKKKK